MAAVTVGTSRAADLGSCGPVPVRTAGPAAADRSPAAARPGRAVRSWPLLVLAAPASAEVLTGWVGIAQKTGFGLVSPLPGIWPHCTWTPPSLSRSASRPTRRTRCAPGCPATRPSETGPAGSPRGQRSSPSRSAWPGRWPITSWPGPERCGHRGLSPPSCPACRSWSWPWGPRWLTCCAPTLTPPRAHQAIGLEDPQGPSAPPGPLMTTQDRSGSSGSIRAHSSSRTIHGGCCPFLTARPNHHIITGIPTGDSVRSPYSALSLGSIPS